MEFDEIVVKESPGLCRCCLSEGCYKDLGTEYTWMDDTEVYADMLLECFDISISQHNEGPNGPNRLICEVCITRLRDACNFKKQVLASEKKFVDMIGRGAFKPKVLVYQSPVKAETNMEIPQQVEEPDVEYLEADLEYEDEDLQKEDESIEHVTEDITVTTLPVKGKRGRPRKNAVVVKSNKKAKVTKSEEKPKTSKAVSKGDCTNATESEKHETACVKEDDVSDDGLTVLSIQRHRGFSAKERRKIIRKNVIQILQNSTLTPFRWLRKFYRCFFCREIFKTPNEWRLHQSLHNFTKELHVAVNSYWESVVYVDVSNIACKLCTDAITDLNELIDHLVNKHGIKFNEAIGRCMSGFKLDDNFVYCLCCDKKFYTFSHVLVHTNKDHKGGNDVLCDICGQYYRSLIYLRYHIRSEHSDGVKCRQCGILLRYTKLRTHMQNVHGKKYKCFNCLEMFETQYKRAQHTMNVHGDRKVISCQYCSKTFVYKSTMLRHVKESHLRERNTQCNICGWKSFAVYALQRHMIKHSTVRSVKCPACDKTFKTNKTMKQHCINIHQKS